MECSAGRTGACASDVVSCIAEGWGVSVEELWKALILWTAGLIERCVTAPVRWCWKRCVQSNAKALVLRCSMVCEGVRELCVSVVCVLA